MGYSVKNEFKITIFTDFQQLNANELFSFFHTSYIEKNNEQQ